MLSFPYMLYLNNAPLMYLLLRYLIFIFDYHLLPPDDPRWDLHSGVFVLEERVLQLAARGQIPWRNLVSPCSHAGPQQVDWVCFVFGESICDHAVRGEPTDLSICQFNRFPDDYNVNTCPSVVNCCR